MSRAPGSDQDDPDPRGVNAVDARAEAPGATLQDDPEGRPRQEPSAATQPAARGGAPEIGEVVSPDRYEIGTEVARGGIGRILRARDIRLQRTVAVKELSRDDPVAIRRFLREIRITARLSHPNIVPLYAAGRWPTGQLFYAMKLVEGKTLASVLREANELPARLHVIPVLLDVAEAMAYAHHLGIVHRDLKPSNVLVGPFGETVVIDWGLAKHVDEPDEEPASFPDPSASPYDTSPGVIVGTPAYMPPEQAAGGAVDRRADVYAIGAMLHHLVLGRSPYEDETEDGVLRAVRLGPPVPLLKGAPDAPPDLVAIAEKAMARDPKARYPTARELAIELRAYASGGLVGAYHYGLLELARRFLERRRGVVLTAIAALGALAAFGSVSVARIAEERDRARTSAIAERSTRAKAELQVDELLVEKARALLDRDPTMSVALLKRPKTVPEGAATIAAWAEERGVAERVLRGHSQAATAVLYSPDGRFLVTGGDDKRVVLWNGSDGAAIELALHGDRVTKIAIDEKGTLIASASYDGTVHLSDASGRLVSTFSGHHAPVKSVAFSGDGSALCSIATDGEVRVWDVKSGVPKSRAGAADRDLFCAFSKDGAWVLSGSHGGELRLWNPRTGIARSLAGHRGPVRSAEFSPNGSHIASGGDDGTVRLWPFATGAGTIVGRSDSIVLHVTFSPDGTRIASAEMGGSVRLWDLASGAARVVSSHAERVAALAFSDDGRYLASSGWDKAIRVKDLGTEASTTLRGHSDVVVALAFSKGGSHLASASWDKTVRIWGAHYTHQRRVLRGHTVGVRTVAFSPDGRLIASGGHDNAVRVWDVATGGSRVFTGHGDHVYRVLFSPDGRLLASSSDDKTVRIWSLSDGSVRVLEGHRDDVEELAFSPDGTLLASASEDATARLWPTAGGPPAVLEHDHDVTGVAFDRSGGTLATSSRDGTVRLWDGRSGAQRRVLRGHKDEVWGLAFSPDGTRVASASADDSVIVWDPASDRRVTLAPLPGARALAFSPNSAELAVAGDAPKLWVCTIAPTSCRDFVGHTAVVHDLTFVPGGRSLATASGDGTVDIWDLETRERRVLEGHAAPVFGLATSPDGGTIASASGDADVRLWSVVPPPHPATLRAFLDALSREGIAPGMSKDLGRSE